VPHGPILDRVGEHRPERSAHLRHAGRGHALALEAEEEAPHVLRLDLVEAVAAQVWDDVVVERPPVLDTRRLREAALSAAPVRVDPLPGVLLDRDTGGGPAVPRRPPALGLPCLRVGAVRALVLLPAVAPDDDYRVPLR